MKRVFRFIFYTWLVIYLMKGAVTKNDPYYSMVNHIVVTNVETSEQVTYSKEDMLYDLTPYYKNKIPLFFFKKRIKIECYADDDYMSTYYLSSLEHISPSNKLTNSLQDYTFSKDTERLLNDLIDKVLPKEDM